MDDKVKVKDRTTPLEALKEADELTGSPLVVKPVAYPLETLDPEARQQTPAVPVYRRELPALLAHSGSGAVVPGSTRPNDSPFRSSIQILPLTSTVRDSGAAKSPTAATGSVEPSGRSR